MNWTIEGHEDAPNGEMLVAVRITNNPSWFWRLLGVAVHIDETQLYIGETCFWQKFPSFEVAGTDMSLFLSAYYDRTQYEKNFGLNARSTTRKHNGLHLQRLPQQGTDNSGVDSHSSE